MMQISLFPLKTVLFPQGVLPLRIFEPRYMDMVRDCLKEEKPFGVVMLTQGKEVDSAVRTEKVGCLAFIRAWDMQQLGLLHIRTVGAQRFRIEQTHRRSDGLHTAEVILLPDDPQQPIAEEHKPCVELLVRIVDDMRAQLAEKRRNGEAEGEVLSALPFEEPLQLESAAWVGNRLCEVLPVPLKAKQKLMELDDAHARLEIVSQYLRQHAILR